MQIFGSRRGGRSTMPPLPAPWKEVGYGVWTAPIGTPEPFAAPPPTVEQFNAWMAELPVIDADTMRPPGWLTAAEIEDLLREPDVDAYREAWRKYLNEVVEAQPAGAGIVTTAPAMATAWTGGNPLEDLRAAMRRINEADLPPARRLEAGWMAVDAIKQHLGPARPRGWSKDMPGALGSLAWLTGIPIVPKDDELAPNQWRLVDARTGEVLHEGTLGPALEEYHRVAREAADQIADEAGVPRDLLY